jgi:molybdopterin synthase catalytic subunit
VYLTDGPIDVVALFSQVRPSDGGVCVFVGVVRNENAGRKTERIEYQAYGSMAEAEIARIEESLRTEFRETRLVIRHRIGTLEVGEASVAILAASPHRAEAFAACRAAIDRIKTTVPIWKREFHPDGTSEWVDPTKDHPC